MSGKNVRKQRQEVREIIRVLKRVENGAVILVKNHALTQYQVDKILDALVASGREDCIMLGVDNFNDLSVANEEQMLEHGWQRLPVENSDDNE